LTSNVNTIGVVLLNLGGPDSLEAVRPFLYNLFSDRDIIRLGPSLLQKPIAWLISTLRSKKTEGMYSQIGGKSPILDITRAQAAALENMLNESTEHRAQSTDIPATTRGAEKYNVYVGMRYWNPFMRDTVREIQEDGVKDIIVLSLYPHYSKATTGSSISDFKKAIEGKDFNIRYIEQWYDFQPYINSMATLAAETVAGYSGNDFHLLYSAHSLPQSFIDEGDPYLDQIKTTIAKINARLSEPPYNISNDRWGLSFQSKTGPVKWLEPSTEETILKLASEECKNLIVVPISFVSDHIETLYEIDILYRDLARRNGINLVRCRSLNTHTDFIHALKALVLSKIEQASSEM
jgi:ferrochelatase